MTDSRTDTRAASDTVVRPASYYLQLDGIPGGSQDNRHRDWIDLLGFSWGASNSGASAGLGGGAGAGRSEITELTVTMPLGPASPTVFLFTMNGRHIPAARLEGVFGGKQPMTFVRLELADVTVRGYQTSAGNATPVDSCALTFDRITYTYWGQNADGTVGSPVVITWSARTHGSP